jgi:hypothetical protein
MLYLTTIWMLQPEERLGSSACLPKLGRLLYDDYDVTAFSVRGLNAECGRRPGRLTDPCTERKPVGEAALADSQVPFYLEYPPATLVLFRLPYWLPPKIDLQRAATDVGDACHNDIVEHFPRTPDEQALWRKFRHAARTFNAFGIGCLLLLTFVVRADYCRGQGVEGAILLFVLPASLYFSANRFDVLPALLTALSLAFLGRDRLVASAVCLGLATMVKVYPGFVSVFVIRFLFNRPRAGLSWFIAYLMTLIVAVIPAFASWGWEANIAPYQVQLSRTLEAWTFYGLIFPMPLGEDSTEARIFRLGVVIVALLILSWRKVSDIDGILRRSAVVLIFFVSLQVFFSPQWVLWLSPLLVPLAGKDRTIFWLTLALDLITYFTFPAAWDLEVPNQHILLSVLTYGRAIVLAWLVIRLLVMEFRNRHVSASPAQ